jgi:hypothetical protein
MGLPTRPLSSRQVFSDGVVLWRAVYQLEGPHSGVEHVSVGAGNIFKYLHSLACTMNCFQDRDRLAILNECGLGELAPDIQLVGLSTGDHSLYNGVTGRQLMYMGNKNQSWLSLQRGSLTYLGVASTSTSTGPLR